MIELLAVPAWDTARTPLSAWVERLEGQGWTVVVNHESTNVAWIVVNALRLRGYVVLAGGRDAEAINFELAAADPTLARAALEQAAAALAWELHDEENGDDDLDDNDG